MRSLLGFTNKQLRRIEGGMAFIAGLMVLALMMLGVAEVVGRTLLNRSIPGGIDIVMQLMVPVAAFGIAYCQSNFGNVRMTLLTGGLKGRVKWIFEALSICIAALVALALTRGSWLYFLRSFEVGADTPQLGIPIWIAVLIATISLAMLFARLLFQLVESIILIISPSAKTVSFSD